MRPINLIVLHCSATKETEAYTPGQLEADHKARGFDRAGYNYYVLRSGKVVPMRPLAMVPAHVTGYNRHSIGICYEGGLNGNGLPADTRTLAQRIALERMIRQLAVEFPNCRICGHRDLANKACPCFDAAAEYRHLAVNA
jgi:N-acetylmuramoyl-L-alanine amidase